LQRSALACNLLSLWAMTAEAMVQLMEEMMDIKIQQLAQSSMKVTAEVARLLQDKRDTDRRRLEQIRTELVRILKG
jgi:hypothetical protein